MNKMNILIYIDTYRAHTYEYFLSRVNIILNILNNNDYFIVIMILLTKKYRSPLNTINTVVIQTVAKMT